MACATAFLAVNLDGPLKAALQEVADAVEGSADELLGVKDIGFTPHGQDKLHMTFVFCGEALHKLPRADLVKLHGDLLEVVSGADSMQTGQLEFKSFELFPPDKQNLIIAHFEAPPTLQALRKALWNVCLKYGVAVKDDEDWMAHVTLGKIKATKAQVCRVTCAALPAPAFPAGSLKPLGLTLLGARPRQAWLDWADALLFSKASSTAAASADLLAANDVACEERVSNVERTSLVDLDWLASALQGEVADTDAEGLLAAVEVILGCLEDGPSEFEESVTSAEEVLRDGGAPVCAAAFRSHCRSL